MASPACEVHGESAHGPGRTVRVLARWMRARLRYVHRTGCRGRCRKRHGQRPARMSKSATWIRIDGFGEPPMLNIAVPQRVSRAFMGIVVAVGLSERDVA